MNKLVERIRNKLTDLQRALLTSLVTIDVHARDITLAMIADKVDNVNDFSWLKILRYYWKDPDGCEVHQSNSAFSYSYEYLGCTPRLVITPLTDRCCMFYLPIFQLNEM